MQFRPIGAILPGRNDAENVRYLRVRDIWADVSNRRISLKNPVAFWQRAASARVVSEAKLGLSASCGEDRRWEGDELGQFPQILGGGR